MWKGKEKITKFEYLENQKSFFDEVNNIFIVFEGLLVWCKNKNFKNSEHKLYKVDNKILVIGSKYLRLISIFSGLYLLFQTLHKSEAFHEAFFQYIRPNP